MSAPAAQGPCAWNTKIFPICSTELACSADLQYPRGLHDGRLSLPLSKLRCLIFIGVDAGESFPIFVKHRDLKVSVFTSSVLPQLGAFLYRFCFRHGCLLYTSDAADDLLCVDLGG